MYINIYPQFYYYNLYFMYRKKKTTNERGEPKSCIICMV